MAPDSALGLAWVLGLHIRVSISFHPGYTAGKLGCCLNLAKTHDNRNNMFSIQTIGLVKQIHDNAMQSHPMIHQST
jgi:hypothetical protein